jgi:biopolymer transport protein ExbB
MKRYILTLTLLLAGSAFAAEPASSPSIAVSEVIRNGGWTMIVILAMAGIATFLAIYYLFTLRASVLMPREFRLEVEELGARGDVEALTTVCKDHSCAGARIIGAVAAQLHVNPTVPYAVLRDAMEDSGGRQSALLWQRIQYLMDIAVVAPMVGLLGTVIGMIQAFVGLAEDFSQVQPVMLTAGVSKALVSTAGGLIVGICGMLVYAYFRGRVNGLITQLEEQCAGVLQGIIANR